MLTYLLFLLFDILSALPMFLLYIIFSPLYIIIAFVVRYRRSVVNENLRISFPEKSAKERHKIAMRYYWNLTLLIVESVKMPLMSRKAVMSRYRCSNPEIVNRYYDQGRSVVLLSSHYNNWEWMLLSLKLQFKHHGIGLVAPNTNKIFEKHINKSRMRFGTHIVFHDTIREVMEYYEKNHLPAAYMFLADQSPSNPHRCWITNFLNHKTGFLLGAESFARRYNLPVLYYEVVKEKNGYYHIDIQLITDNISETEFGSVTQRYAELLAQTINHQPEHWLWSHKRWKLNLDGIENHPISA